MANIAPANPYPERGDQFYGEVIAQNRAREGSRPHAEGLGEEADYRAAFGQGARIGRPSGHVERGTQVYETEIATNVRTKLAAVDPPPVWDAVDMATKAGMVAGTSGGGQQTFESKIAPCNGGRRANAAAYWD